MTLLNYYLEPDRASLLSDTLVSYNGMPAAMATKVLPLSHAHALIAHRGPVDFLWRAAEKLETTHYENGIDGLAGVLPDLCCDVQDRIEDHYLRNDLPSELVVLGWSPSCRSFQGLYLASKDDFAVERRARGGHVSPGPVGWIPPELPRAPDEATWIRLAEHQAAVLAKEAKERGDPDGAWTVGGDLLVYNLTTTGLAVRKIHRFSSYEASLEAVRAFHARNSRLEATPAREDGSAGMEVPDATRSAVRAA